MAIGNIEPCWFGRSIELPQPDKATVPIGPLTSDDAISLPLIAPSLDGHFCSASRKRSRGFMANQGQDRFGAESCGKKITVFFSVQIRSTGGRQWHGLIDHNYT